MSIYIIACLRQTRSAAHIKYFSYLCGPKGFMNKRARFCLPPGIRTTASGYTFDKEVAWPEIGPRSLNPI